MNQQWQSSGHAVTSSASLRSWMALLVLFLQTGSTHAGTPVAIGSQRELFVDGGLVESISGAARIELNHPEHREIVMRHDAPWEGSGCGYHSIFRDGDLYKMYYKAWDLKTLEDRISVGDNRFACYAESKDGIHWVKPSLGLHEFLGNKDSNIVLVTDLFGETVIDPVHLSVFKDENPQVASDGIYKAVVLGHVKGQKKETGLVILKSGDGFHWQAMTDRPVITEGAFDSQNLAFWDPVRKEYRAYWRYFNNRSFGEQESYRKNQGLRDILTATSPDLINWSKPVPLDYPGAAHEQLYVNQVRNYHRAPHLLIGFPVRYTDRGVTGSLSHLPDWEHRQKRIRTSPRYGTAITECLLMSSRDGVSFHRWPEAFLRPGIQRPGTWNYGQQYVAWHPVETVSDLPGAPPELSFYATEHYWMAGGSHLRRYVMRLDGFASLNAPMTGGELVTVPLQFEGNQLEINFSSSAAGSVQVELLTAKGGPIPGYQLADCDPIYGDELSRTVTWKNRADVSSLAGKGIQVRFRLQDADLYSYRFYDRAAN